MLAGGRRRWARGRRTRRPPAGRVRSGHGTNRRAGQAQRHPVLRPRRERDLRGPGREPRPDRGPGPCPRLGRHGRRPRVAPPVRTCVSATWQKAIHRRGRPSPMPVPVLRAGVRKDAVMKIATNYFEDRREALIDMLGAADAGRRHRLRRPSGLDPADPDRGAHGGGQGGPWPAGAAGRPEPRWDRPGRPARELARGAGRGVRHGRLAGAPAVHLRCDPVDAVRRGRPAAPAGAVAEHLRHAAISCHSSPSRSSGARTGSPAWSTCGSGRAATSRSRTAPTGSWVRSGMPSPRRSPGGASSR